MKVLNTKSPKTKFQLKQTTYDGTSYICPTWDQMGVYNFELAKKIIASGQTFDRIIALAKGGWTWTRDMADALQVPELSSIRIKSYTGVNEAGEPKITQPLTDHIHGERILLFDEVIDSGLTIQKAKEHIIEKGAAKVQVATLCYKPRSVIQPDFFAFSSESWVVFPHEMREFVEGSKNTWQAKGVSIAEVKKRLQIIGVPLDQIEFYCSLHLD